MSKLKDVLNEAKKKDSKMLPELHALDDTIEKFIQKLEDKINKIKDNPIFVKKAFQLLGDMSKEYSEFMFALRAIVNAVDRKGLVLPKEKPIGRVRDVNSRHRSPDENQPDPEEAGMEPEEGQDQAPPPKGVKEALLIEGKTVAAIRKKAEQLKKKLDGKPVKENFGQKEVRQLEDFSDIWSLNYDDRLKAIKIIDDFNQWAMNYTGR